MVRLKVKKENIDDFIKESIKDAVGSVDIEPGCRRFDIIQDQTDPTLFAQETNSLVVPAIADTTTTTSLPCFTSAFTFLAIDLTASILATEVPPNF